MNINTFESSTILDAPIEAVYALHENPHNIPKVSPSGFSVRRIEANPEAVAGEKFTVEASQFFLPIRWEGVWDQVEHPTLLADRALRSPFADFRHEHRFESIDIGCRTRMTDHVEFELPGGPAMQAVGGAVIRAVFTVMFAARHHATRGYFAGSVTPEPIRSPLGRSGLWLAAGLLIGGCLGFAWNRRRR
ncbi:MAG: SRPBCC family protein [Chthoniobacterales bacterium]